MERLLLFVLDEAMWSGDKEAEGILKDLITGSEHHIEHKGKETYSVDNLTRISIIGNEDWIVPMSHDERRFTVFEVGDARIQDTKYFEELKEGMASGGNRLLMAHLLNLDISCINLNIPLKTDAATQQKIASMPPLGKWWHDCLQEKGILGGRFCDEWPSEIPTNVFRESCEAYCNRKNWKVWHLTATKFGMDFKKFFPKDIQELHEKGCKTKDDMSQKFVNGYKLPSVKVSREVFEGIYGKIHWLTPH